VIPQTQSRVGKRGRCFNACLASILELPETEVPDFDVPRPGERGIDYDGNIERWLAKRGLRYRRVPTTVTPVGYHTIEGKSPRGGQHAIVGFNGKPVHDPHPQDGTGRGLVSVSHYGVLLPIDRAHAKDAVVTRLPKAGEPIKLPNGKRATVKKVTAAIDLFGDKEYHVLTTTGEVVPVTLKEIS
jgi:hypothetical protein